MDRKSSRSQFVIWISNGYGWMVCCCRGPYFYYCSTPPSIKDDLEIGRERAKHSTTYLLPFHRIYAKIPQKSSILELIFISLDLVNAYRAVPIIGVPICSPSFLLHASRISVVDYLTSNG